MKKPMVIEIEFGEKYAGVYFHNVGDNSRKRLQRYIVTEQNENYIRLFKLIN